MKEAVLQVERSEAGFELVLQCGWGSVFASLLAVGFGGFWVWAMTSLPGMGYLVWGVCAVLMTYYYAVRTQYRLERPSQQFEIVSHYLVRRRTQRYPLSVLERVAFEEVVSTSSEGGESMMYTVSLYLRDGTRVGLTDTSSDEVGKRALAELLEREIVGLRSAA